jgi:hypothetical protein
MVFAGVALGLGIAGGVVAGGFRLPSRRSAVTPALSSAASTPRAGEGILPPRADRTAAAMAAQQRRDSAIFARVASAPAEAAADRRATVQTLIRDRGAPATEIRLGQTADRRRAGPRAARGGVRSVS